MISVHSGKKLLLGLCLLACAGTSCFTCSAAAHEARKSVQEANALYQKGRIDEALQKYNEANVVQPDSDIVHFNRGAALYKKEDYQKAIDAFTRTLTSDDKEIEADALYDLGNSKYKLARQKENTDLSAAVGLMQEALGNYKRSIELDQKNQDARFNHEFVERELKVLQDKLKQQQSSADKQKSQQQQQQQEQQQEQQQQEQKQGASSTGKESSGSDKDKQGKGEEEKEASGQAHDKQQQEKEKEGQGEPRQQAQMKPQGEQPAGGEPQQAGEKRELSEGQARTLLERYGREEGTPDYMDKRTRRDYDSQVSKDW